MSKLLELFDNNGEYIIAALVAIYELFVRLKPTYKNWSVVELLLTLLKKMVPNRRKPPVLVIVFALMCTTASAQLNGYFKSIRMAVNDTTATLPLNGTIIYNTPTQSFYAYQNFEWVQMIGGGGGGIVGAENGLTVTDDTVRLGGIINGSTVLSLGPTDPFLINRPNGTGLFISPGAGVLLQENTTDGITLTNNDGGVTSLVVKPGEVSVNSAISGFPGITYGGSIADGDYTSLSVTSKEYNDSHLNGYPLDGIPLEGQVWAYDDVNTQWIPVTPVVNTLAINEVLKSDGSGGINAAGITVPSAGVYDLGNDEPAGLRQIRAASSSGGASLELQGKGASGSVNILPTGAVEGVDIRNNGVTVLYNVDGTSGQNNLLSLNHPAKEVAFEHLVDNTTATLRGGHRSGGPGVAKRIFAIMAPSSGADNQGGDDITITSGNGSTVPGDDTTPGGSISITSGTGGNDSDGGDITLSPGAGTGSGTAGNVIILNLPTSAAGLPTGALWNDSGTLKVAP